mmetsp:Transcript_7839/g.17184  ORF Transcript_7839/g.17184 Transcript_7839/m.17184 type:complete len:120 (+) Transcript_7839:667-1026(+)
MRSGRSSIARVLLLSCTGPHPHDTTPHPPQACGARAAVLPSGLSTRTITALTQPFNWWTRDVLLDVDELDLLCSGLTVAEQPLDPRIAPRRSVVEWMRQVGPHLGRDYVSSTQRYYTQP